MIKRGVAGSGDGGRGSRTNTQHCSLLKDAASERRYVCSFIANWLSYGETSDSTNSNLNEGRNYETVTSDTFILF